MRLNTQLITDTLRDIADLIDHKIGSKPEVHIEQYTNTGRQLPVKTL